MGTPATQLVLDSRRLEAVFARCFSRSENTVLAGGAAEPVYQPAEDARSPHRLFYREDFFSSALHEVAHWCIAGKERRALPDFGYWYAPQGRSEAEQRAFEAVEVKPQALEWFFSIACGCRFRVSVDNFTEDGELPDTLPFCQQVATQAYRFRDRGLPQRALQFFHALTDEFNTSVDLRTLAFDARELY